MRTNVWPLSLRIFHWLLAIGFVSAYFLGGEDDLLHFHVAFGLMAGSLIFLRLFYGLFGPQYARFSAFPIGIKNQIEFIRSFFAKTKDYLGHNPLAALTMLAILIVGLTTSITGFLLFGSKTGIVDIAINHHTLKEIHEVAANLFLALVLVHLAGLMTDWYFHKSQKTILSMINGTKNIAGSGYKITAFQKFFGLLWIILPLFIFFASLQYKKTYQTDKLFKHKHYEEQVEK